MKLHFFFLAAGFLRMRTEAGVTSTSCRGGQALRLRFRLEGSLRTAHTRLDIVLRSSSRVRRLANNYSALPRPALLATSGPHPTSSSAMYCKPGKEGTVKVRSCSFFRRL